MWTRTILLAVETPPGVWATIAVLSVGVAAVPMTLRVRGDRRAHGLLQRWAAQQGLELTKQEEIPWGRGPFAKRGYWTTVFRVTARQADGADRAGWVCMNNVFVWGGDAPDVVWDP
jgi:hypothetical protein